MRIVRPIARLARLANGNLAQSGRRQSGTLAPPQSGKVSNLASLATRAIWQSGKVSNLATISIRILIGFALPDCLICPIARLLDLPDLHDCLSGPIGQIGANCPVARLQFARLRQIVCFARLARLTLPDCCTTAIS